MFQSLVKAEVQGTILKEAYEALSQAYKALDKSHKRYIDLVDKTTMEAKGDYLEESSKLYSEVQGVYSHVCNQEERAKALAVFVAAKGKVIVRMQAFKESCEVLIKLSLKKNVSFTDMRAELVMIEDMFERLRAKKQMLR